MSPLEKVTVTNGEAMEIAASLNVLAQHETDAWYALGRNVQSLKRTMKKLDEAKELIQNKFTEKDDKGVPVYTDASKTALKVPAENIEDLNKAWDVFTAEKVEIEIYKIPVTSLTEKIPPQVMIPLLDVIITD